MGKNTKKNLPQEFDPIINETIEFDSKEEKQFYHWLCELRLSKLIEPWEKSSDIYQPPPFWLSGPVSIELPINGKTKSISLLRSHEYTPDFKIKFTKKFYQTFDINIIRKYFKLVPISDDLSDIPIIYIDIKGSFNSNGGDRVFSINQKWVWANHQIYINKIVPDDLFKDFFVPVSELYTEKTKKLRIKYANLRQLTSYF